MSFSVTFTLRLKPEVRCLIPLLCNKVALGEKVQMQTKAFRYCVPNVTELEMIAVTMW